MKGPRQDKNRKALKRLKVQAATLADPSVLDANVIDTVLNTLYRNADKDNLNLHEEIYKPAHIKLPFKESERIWEVLVSTGWITPTIGFGNAGKISLTRAGYQLMAQYGGYKNYLASLQNNNQPQTIIMPIQVEPDDANVTPPQEGEQQSSKTKK